MKYQVVLKHARKRDSFEVLRDLGECDSPEDALTLAKIWIFHMDRQRLYGYEEEIQNAKRLIEWADGLHLDERVTLPHTSIFLMGEDETLYYIS